MKAPKKKTLLYLGKCDDIFERSRELLSAELSEVQITSAFTIAKDGADAANRTQKQAFDVIIIDTKMPRLLEGDFLKTLATDKNTANANLIVIDQSSESLPKGLEHAHQKLTPPFDADLLFSTLLKAVLGDQKIEAVTSATSAATPTQFAVDVRVLNALIKSTLFVVQQFGLSDIKMLKPMPKNPESSCLGDVMSYMEITSELFLGGFVVSFEKSVYLKILTNMLGEEQTEITPDNADAIGELNNMILGNAKPEFTQYNVQMSLPKIIQKGENPPMPPKSVALLISFQLPEGRIYVEVRAHPLQSKAAA